MLEYITQIVIFQLVFLLVFDLFLKKETFFSYNRIYLLVTPVLALVLPIIEFQALQSALPVGAMNSLPEVFIGGADKVSSAEHSIVQSGSEDSSLNWWLILYLTGLLISTGIFLYKFRMLRKLYSHRVVLKNDQLRIIEIPSSRIACTFLNTVFLGKDLSDKEREQVLSHELVHVRQRHTLDLMFFELLKIILWFNPLVYIYQSRISAVHEYIADAGVIKKIEKQTYFQQLLNTAFNTEDISFINQFFNHSIIKKRIVMLQKSKSKSIQKLRFLIVLPLMLAMLTYVACSEDPVISQQESELMAQEKLERIRDIIQDGTALTSEDTEEINKILNTIDPEDLTRGKEKVQVQKLKSAVSGVDGIPFTIIEKVPVFPGCESLKSNAELKGCMSENIKSLVNKNFDTSLGKALGLEGISRIYVQFKIRKDGAIEILGVRAPHPRLEEEARRVIKLLPQMVPGQQKGEEVDVLYSLPISFKVGE